MKFNADRLSKLAGIRPGRGSLNEASNRSYHDNVANDDADYRFGKNQLAEKQVHVDEPGWGQKKWDSGLEEADEDEEVEPMDDGHEYGGGEDEYKRSGGRRTGDVGGHYKDYEMDEDVANDEMDEALWGGGEDEYKRRGGKRTGDVGGHYKDYEMDEADWDEVSELDDPEWRGEGEEEEEEVVLELDERMLRGEVRRMRRERATRLEETNLRKAIRNEIKGIFSELDMYRTDNKWVYGDKQPTNSRKGYVNLTFPGVGFR